MAARAKRTFSRIFSQSVVVCLLALFILVALVAMFFTVGESGEVEWIGMTVRSLDAETAAALGIPSDACGVFVEDVDGIAQRAGVRHGDVLLGIDGKPVRDMRGFSRLAGKTDLSKGGTQLDIIRRGVRMGLPVFVSQPGGLAQPPGQTGLRAPLVADRRWLGIEAETFTAGEGRELGIPVGVRGVLIDGMVRGSLAEQAGLVVNDVIVSVNGQKIDATADLWNVLACLNAAGPVAFGVFRGGRLISAALPAALPAALGTPAGGFPGRMGGRGLGPGGVCVCPNCGTRVAHQRGVACYSVQCPSCGSPMVRAY